MLLRKDNPFSDFLTGSICRFRFSSAISGLNHDSVPRWMKQFSMAEFRLNDGVLEFDIPHSQVDAFGGLFISSKILSNLNDFQIRPLDSQSGTIGTFDYIQRAFSMKAFDRQLPHSSSQVFLRGLLPLLETSKIPSMMIPVKMDELSLIDETNYGGNSFALVLVPIQELKDLTNLPKAQWAIELKTRAERTLRIIKRRSPETKQAPVLTSLIGDLDRIGWVHSQITPRNFQMIPTPNDPGSTNVVFWHRGQEMAVSASYLSGAKPSWLDEVFEQTQRTFS